MRAERFPADDPREWLNRARSNLARAARQDEAVYLEDLCFDAEQAAEKAVKAVFLQRGSAFPFVHDVRRLLDELAAAGVAIPEEVRAAEVLTEYAAACRHPGPGEPVSLDEWQQAVAMARAVVTWAEGVVGAHYGDTGRASRSVGRSET